MNYSIWVIPPEPVKSKLTGIIKNLSMEFNGPVFEPHMTLLGNIGLDLPVITTALNKLAGNFTGLNLKLGPVSFSTTYFQNVLVRVESRAQIMQLNLDLKKLLNCSNDVFMPHISLLYGDHDAKTRELAVSKIPHLEDLFNVKEFVVTPAVPNPSEWVHSAVIPFSDK